MNICVISGSPKGENSITYQTVLYLQKKFPECSFRTLHVGQRIRMFEKDMAEAVTEIEAADLLLFVYPVYTFIAPCQLHRFIELMKLGKMDLEGKFAAQITTSKHFYDTTAHKYVEENCNDLGLKYLGGLSEDMEDLLSEKGREEAITFWKLIQWKAENDIWEKAPASDTTEWPVYTRQFVVSAGNAAGGSVADTKNAEISGEYASSKSVSGEGVIGGNASGTGEINSTVSKKPGTKETVIVASLAEGDESLANMIADFRAVYPFPTKVVNINEYPMSGGCLGCFHCATDGKCIYKDGFDEFLRKEIQTGNAIVYAFTIQDHSMGPRMKMYDDRQFCNGHRTVTMGMPFGYLVNGNLEAEANLQMIIRGRAEVGGNYLAGVATDGKGIQDMAKTLAYAIENRVTQPKMFLGVGGTKIFRDLIWVMQGMMKADHKFYKEHGIYDFPQKQKGTILKMKLVGMLISNPKVQAKMGNKMTEGMLMPYKKVLEGDK